ncbi:hypothetical protein GCM10007854_22050 [Algimonas porphyrae]|uniref:DUF805 domain-containing protein n=2 Tax=Algimonas porphyrae TaxID=1128113 RepID=A0ABQ5V2G0_9PROT|nr:hypothetical protein GCM10007854_22050 [Algimonas porphyrae]
MIPANIALHEWIRRAFIFKGRSTRSHYWWPFLLSFCVQLILMLLIISTMGADNVNALLAWASSQPTDFSGLEIAPLSSPAKFFLVFLAVFSLLTFVPNISLSWRRYQDMGLPGAIHLVFLFTGPFLQFIWLMELVWFAFPGTRGPNRYGPDRVRR